MRVLTISLDESMVERKAGREKEREREKGRAERANTSY
jgi:hypothetical protein